MQVTLFGSCLACFLIYKRVPVVADELTIGSASKYASSAAGSHHHHNSNHRRPFAQIIEGFAVDGILSRKGLYSTQLENEDTMSDSSGYSANKSRASPSYPAPKAKKEWNQITRID